MTKVGRSTQSFLNARGGSYAVERAIGHENVGRILTKQEMEEEEAYSRPGFDQIYEGIASEFENASIWRGIAVAKPWTLYQAVSLPTKDEPNTRTTFLVQKGGYSH